MATKKTARKGRPRKKAPAPEPVQENLNFPELDKKHFGEIRVVDTDIVWARCMDYKPNKHCLIAKLHESKEVVLVGIPSFAKTDQWKNRSFKAEEILMSNGDRYYRHIACIESNKGIVLGGGVS